MNPEDKLNAILDAMIVRVATALQLTPDRVYEYRDTGEQSGEAGYFQATLSDAGGLGMCASAALVECQIGFMKLDSDATRRRLQRTHWAFAIRSALVWTRAQDGVPGAAFPTVTKMDLSEAGDADEGFLMGGLTYTFQIALPDGR